MNRDDRLKYLREYRRNRQTPVPHGTDNGYVNWSCRCDECRRAHRDARRYERSMKRDRVTHQ